MRPRRRRSRLASRPLRGGIRPAGSARIAPALAARHIDVAMLRGLTNAGPGGKEDCVAEISRECNLGLAEKLALKLVLEFLDKGKGREGAAN